MSSPEAEGAERARALTLVMVNRRGLHARAAARFVQTAEKFACDITVAKDGQSVSGRSIMGLLMLAAVSGSAIDVSLRGPDAAAAADALADLVASGFGEDD